MNDAASADGSGGGGGSEFDSFRSDALSIVDSIFEVARPKIGEEEFWLSAEMASGPGTLNFLADTKQLGEDYYGESAPVVKKVKGFAKLHCFDYTTIEFALDEIAGADELLDEKYGPARTAITEGLSTWDEADSDAAKTFKANYVTSLDEFYKDQGISLDHYYSVVLSMVGVAEANRKLLLDLLKKCKNLMDEYSPFWGVTNPWLSWALDLGLLLVPEAVPVKGGAAFVSKKAIEAVAGKLMEGGKKTLEDYESVALIVQGIMDGIDELEKNSNEAFDAIAQFGSQFLERDTPEKNVMPCPRY